MRLHGKKTEIFCDLREAWEMLGGFCRQQRRWAPGAGSRACSLLCMAPAFAGIICSYERNSLRTAVLALIKKLYISSLIKPLSF